ncbi:hypothetical protein [Pseudomonas sp. BBP2017]|uniref:hypothetical protein n=1 Tax=Pseudomonas sp. BBP2017 TaxID=2109731 RepID=UPI000D117F78|nr:hypothetical protein [Pseudomonas sp. BBP2017]PSS49416.1 hypothetical protein C6382_18990 [Pseudomonas sp. BBP2017]
MIDDEKADMQNDFQNERQYLEGLLATRVNWFLIFMSFYFVAAFNLDDGQQRAIALAFGGMFSLAISLSVLRTMSLVEDVLIQFRKQHKEHPYTVAFEHLSEKPVIKVSANKYIAALPLIATAAFIVLALFSCSAPQSKTPSDTPAASQLKGRI